MTIRGILFGALMAGAAAVPATMSPAAAQSAQANANAWGVTQAEVDTLLPATLLAEARFEARRSEIESAAKAGDAVAMTLLSLAYDAGIGIPRDLKESFYWASRSAAEGNGRGMNILAAAYRGGRGVDKDSRLALGWLEKAVALGNNRAKYQLGQMLLEGEGLEKNPVKAMLFLTEAAQAGDLAAAFVLGDVYANGDEGVAQDAVQAEHWFGKAGPYGLRALGNHLLHHDGFPKVFPLDVERGVALLREAAAGNDALAHAWLGLMYDRGDVLPKDAQQAVVHREVAARGGILQSQRDLAWAYWNGVGTTKDQLQAVLWWRKAADEGEVVSQAQLGYLHMEGIVVAKDLQEAEKYLLAAAQKGRAAAQTNLGLLYRRAGKNDLAQEWTQKAAAQGEETAIKNLAIWAPKPVQVAQQEPKKKKGNGGLFGALGGAMLGAMAGGNTEQIVGAAMKGAAMVDPNAAALDSVGDTLISGNAGAVTGVGALTGGAGDGGSFPTRPNALDGSPACSMMNQGNYRDVSLSGGNDVQLKTMCGQAFEYYSMYLRAIEQGYSEADANRTYDAHQQAALNAISFYQNNR